MYEVVYTDSPDFSDEMWRKYFDLLATLHERYQSLHLTRSWTELKKRLTDWQAVEPGSKRAVVHENDRLLGWIDVRIRSRGTPDQVAYLRFDALFDHHPGSFTDLVARVAVTQMSHYDLAEMFFIVDDQRGIETARQWQAEELCRTDRYVLRRNGANWPVIREWLDTIPGNNLDLQMRFYEYPPLDRAEEYCVIFNAAFEDMPQEREAVARYKLDVSEMRKFSEWCRKNGVFPYNYILFDDHDTMVGFTNVSINTNTPEDVFQAMTGVVRSYRGRGLAKWLKAAMFAKVGEDFPENESFNTVMRAVNEPIQAINAQMGYRLERRGFEFRLSRERIEGRG